MGSKTSDIERLTRVEEGLDYVKKAVDSNNETLKSIANNLEELSRVSIRQEQDRNRIHDLERSQSDAAAERKALRNDLQSYRQENINFREWIKARWWMLTSLAAVLIIVVNLLFKIFPV